MVHSVLRLSFPVYRVVFVQASNSRALDQMYLSLGADIGRGGSPNHRQI